MRLTTSAEHAKSLILSIPHQTCAKAVDHHWSVRSDESVSAQSVFWLFCWAKTGMNSEAARVVAGQVFDRVLPIKFAELDCAIEHEYAREARYTTRDIEQEFAAIVNRFCPADKDLSDALERTFVNESKEP